MSGLASMVFNIELSLTIAIVTSFVLAFLLFLINVPNSEHSRKLVKAKNTIAMCFFISSILFFVCYTYSGIQDYEVLISKGYFYVDKTDFIREWWESGDEVTLIARPRRFGKTLNMSMLEKFF